MRGWVFIFCLWMHEDSVGFWPLGCLGGDPFESEQLAAGVRCAESCLPDLCHLCPADSDWHWHWHLALALALAHWHWH